jgi:hypothetical protein
MTNNYDDFLGMMKPEIQEAVKANLEAAPKPKRTTPKRIAEAVKEWGETKLYYAFQQVEFASGTDEARRVIVAEYEKRIGPWPAHIKK